MFLFLVQRKWMCLLHFLIDSLWLAPSRKQRLISSSGSQFLHQGLGAQMSPVVGTHIEVPALCLGLKTDLVQQETGAEFAEVGKRPTTHLLMSRSKASHFIVSGERKWKNKGKANRRMKGKGKSLSYGVSVVSNEEQLNCVLYDLCIRSLPLKLSRN